MGIHMNDERSCQFTKRELKMDTYSNKSSNMFEIIWFVGVTCQPVTPKWANFKNLGHRGYLYLTNSLTPL